MNKGLFFAIGAYGMWGLLPLYWKALQNVPAKEIVSHRMVWSLVFVAVLLAVKRQWRWFTAAAKQPATLLIVFAAGCILAVNWLIYVWAVNAGYVIETSLGYFINPLVSVLLGVVFFRERLRLGQWLAVATAGLGVLYLTLQYGTLPWIALALAFSFGIYGASKKLTPLAALEGLSLETALLFLPALLYLLFLEGQGDGSFGHMSTATTLLLALTGVATGLPLLLFATATRLIPLSMVGILQFIAPTINFLLGVFVYNEPFDHHRMIGFSLIWAALLIYTVEGGIFQHIQARQTKS